MSVLLGAQGFHTNTRCEARHRDLLQETASFGRECGDTKFYDCCAVSSRMCIYYVVAECHNSGVGSTGAQGAGAPPYLKLYLTYLLHEVQNS